MAEKFLRFLTNQDIPYSPCAAYDLSRKGLVHLYENITLDPNTFQSQVSLYASRKESFSGNVAVVYKLQDEKVSFKDEKASMEVTVVTEYVPWRLHRQSKKLTYEQALFLIDGAAKGIRELLHRTKSPFLIQKYMIGVDASGQVKVWWNEHFFRNKFSFTLSSDVRMKDMVYSLVNIIASMLDTKDGQIFKSNLTDRKELTFVNLERIIQQMSKGLNLKVIGVNMLAENTEIAFVNKRSLDLVSSPQRQSHLTNSKVTPYKQQTIIVPQSPRKKKQEDHIISKRIYKDGLTPPQHLKMNIIKQDIERLRSSVDQRQSPLLRQSRSLTNMFSYERALKGDTSIPEVSRVIKNSQVQDVPTVSQFIEFKSEPQFTTPVKQNPQNCEICTGVESLRLSRLSSSKKNIALSRIKSLENLSTSRCMYSTERSINDPRIKESLLQARFRESEKKVPPSTYFASVIE